jgi:hypothetical protein
MRSKIGLKIAPHRKVKMLDPPRYPNVISGYENEMVKSYNNILAEMLKGLAVKLNEII